MSFCQQRDISTLFLSGQSLSGDPGGRDRPIGKGVLLYRQWHHGNSAVTVCLAVPEHSVSLQGGSPSTPSAQDHYMFGYYGAFRNSRSPQRRRWVNWFLSLESTFRWQHLKMESLQSYFLGSRRADLCFTSS
ncbi:hypothetical protein ATANTOWER_020268 [Ataeniobius toweri]|uniref:Uncharacterized protein n=1 Tax=Ataeniobius toweri TaxID=208326 RepID=A0ABU7BH89_9TELE|nr:hypothetical protein [Ataeniobius toweri]